MTWNSPDGYDLFGTVEDPLVIPFDASLRFAGSGQVGDNAG